MEFVVGVFAGVLLVSGANVDLVDGWGIVFVAQVEGTVEELVPEDAAFSDPNSSISS